MQASSIANQPRLRLGVAALLDRLFGWLLLSYLFITLFLPSGTIFGVKLKLPLYVGLLPLAIFSFFYRRQATQASLLRLTGIPMLAGFWLLVAFVYGIPVAGALRQYTDVTLTCLLCWLVLVFCDEQQAKQLSFLRLVLNAEVAAALLKLSIVTYSLIRGVPVVVLMTSLSVVFGVDLMTMDLGSFFGRIQFVSDSVLPICVYVILRHRVRLKLSILSSSLLIVLLLLSTLISFSRFFWGFMALALFVGLLLGKRDRFQACLVGSLGVTILATLPILITLSQLRFSGDVAGYSDSFRFEQASALEELFYDAPLLGHGFGSYSSTVLRGGTSEADRFSYEMQIVALAGQVGLVGILAFVLLLLWYYRDLWWRSRISMRERLGLFLLLACWLAAGLYNPLLLNPVAGVNYAMLATLAALERHPRRTTIQLSSTYPVMPAGETL